MVVLGMPSSEVVGYEIWGSGNGWVVCCSGTGIKRGFSGMAYLLSLGLGLLYLLGILHLQKRR